MMKSWGFKLIWYWSVVMLKKLIALAVVACFTVAVTPVFVGSDVQAQQSKKSKKYSKKVKAGKNQKVCRYKFPDGEKRTWVCDKAVPCCAWDAIKYVKCGTTWSGCF